MTKKYTAGKIAGIIFCVITAALAVLFIIAGSYYGGQMKLIDKYYKSLERGDYDSFVSCIGKDSDMLTGEADFERRAAEISSALENPEDFKAEVRFKSRENLGDGVYLLQYSLTVYNDSGSAADYMNSLVVREGGKWLIMFA